MIALDTNQTSNATTNRHGNTPIMHGFIEELNHASPVLRQGWNQIHGNPHVLFDNASPAWREQPIAEKIHYLEQLELEGLLDLLLGEYFLQCCVPNGIATAGLMLARAAYHTAGYELRMPAELFTTQRRYHTFEVASLARLLEDGHLRCHDPALLTIEMRRLHGCIETWLRVHGESLEAFMN